MGGYLKQSTAAHIMFGPFVDKTTGVDLEVGAGIITSIDHATTGIFLSKNGAAGAIRHQAVTASVLDAYGMFQVHLDTTDTDTVGRLRVMMAEAATFLPVYDDFMVVPANVYDSLMGTDTLDVQVTGMGADVVTAAAIAAGAIDNATFAADVGSTAYATNIIALAVQKTVVENNLNHLAKDATAAVDMTAELPDGTILSRIISNSDTSQFVPATSNLTQIGALTITTAAHIQADYGATEKTCIDLLDDAAGGLVDIHTDIGTVTADVAAVHVHAQTIENDVAAVHVHAGLIQTDTNAIRIDASAILLDTAELQAEWVDGGRLDLILDTAAAASPSAATISDAVWNELRADHTTVGTFGEVTSTADLVDDIWDEPVAGHTTGGTAGYWVANPTVDQIAVAVWNEMLPGAYAVGSAGAYLAAAGSAADPWATTLPGAYAGMTAGHIIGHIGLPVAASISADIAAVGVQVDGVHTDVGTLAADVAAVHVHVGTIDGHITADYGAIEKAAVDLLDDAAGGLADIHTDVGTLTTNVAAVKAETAAIVADTNELQVDWRNGGRLDLLLDAASSAGDPWGTPIPGAYAAGTAGFILGNNINAPIATVDTVVDSIYARLGAPAGASMSADIASVKAETAAILVDTGTTLDANITAILADTGELQTDWVNGGRLDLLLDAASAPTAAANAAAVWGYTLETGFTATAVQRIMFAVLSGLSADHALGIPKFYGVDGITVRAQATVDADGNRTLMSRSGA